MTAKEIKNFRQRVERYIDTRRLRDAIKDIKEMAQRRMAWEVIDRLERAEESYAYMLRYVADGVNDPERQTIYNSIVIDIYAALDAMVFFLEKTDSPTQYFSNVRMFEQNRQPNRIERIIKAYADLASNLSIFSLLASGNNAEQKESQREMERLQSELFVAIWATAPLTSNDADTLRGLLRGDEYSAELKTQVVSAITLGLMQRYDHRRLELLLDIYMGEDNAMVSSAALVGLLLGLWTYRARPLPKSVANRLAAAKDKPNWHSDLRITFLELIRARDTERLNKKINDEIVPDMMKLRPEIMSKVNDGELNPNDMASLEENPEWQELLDKTGLTDKIKELTEMQIEGGDVMMGTFAHLKTFQFFNDIANWFLPFSSSHSSIKNTADRLGVMTDLIENASFLCDSDKYSFLFALEMVPPEQRNMMTAQLQSQSDSIYEAMGQMSQLTAPEARRKTVNRYMQNIYRFFKLYRRHDEFTDPFDTGVNLISVPALSGDFNDIELLKVVGEFYFKLGYMRDALDVFSRLAAETAADAQHYQKMGYCYERLNDYKNAISCYKRAELLDNQSAWLLRRLGACYRAEGDTDMAIKYYRQLTQLDSGDLSAALLLGYVLLEKGDYDEAVKQFYMVEFLDEKSSKSWRPLAWTLFLTGDLEASRRYYAKIIQDHPSPNDYLNMGHAALAGGDMRSAINYYELSVQNRNNDREAFLQSLVDDIPALQKAGVDPTLIPLVADAVFYALDR